MGAKSQTHKNTGDAAVSYETQPYSLSAKQLYLAWLTLWLHLMMILIIIIILSIVPPSNLIRQYLQNEPSGLPGIRTTHSLNSRLFVEYRENKLTNLSTYPNSKILPLSYIIIIIRPIRCDKTALAKKGVFIFISLSHFHSHLYFMR